MAVYEKDGTGKDMRQFSTGPIKKLSRILEIVSHDYVKGDGRHSEHFLYSKTVHTYGVCAVLNS